MKSRHLSACAAILAATCLAVLVAGAPVRKSGTVRLPGTIEFRNPDVGSWEWTSGARCLMYSPKAVALLIDGKRDAVIRFHLFNAGDYPPGEVAAAYGRLFMRDGWSHTAVRDGGKMGETSIVFSDGKPDGTRGKLTVKLLPGNPKLTVLVIGFWRDNGSSAVSRDFDAAAGSVKWCPPEK